MRPWLSLALLCAAPLGAAQTLLFTLPHTDTNFTFGDGTRAYRGQGDAVYDIRPTAYMDRVNLENETSSDLWKQPLHSSLRHVSKDGTLHILEVPLATGRQFQIRDASHKLVSKEQASSRPDGKVLFDPEVSPDSTYVRFYDGSTGNYLWRKTVGTTVFRSVPANFVYLGGDLASYQSGGATVYFSLATGATVTPQISLPSGYLPIDGIDGWVISRKSFSNLYYSHELTTGYSYPINLNGDGYIGLSRNGQLLIQRVDGAIARLPLGTNNSTPFYTWTPPMYASPGMSPDRMHVLLPTGIDGVEVVNVNSGTARTIYPHRHATANFDPAGRPNVTDQSGVYTARSQTGARVQTVPLEPGSTGFLSDDGRTILNYTDGNGNIRRRKLPSTTSALWFNYYAYQSPFFSPDARAASEVNTGVNSIVVRTFDNAGTIHTFNLPEDAQVAATAPNGRVMWGDPQPNGFFLRFSDPVTGAIKRNVQLLASTYAEIQNAKFSQDGNGVLVHYKLGGVEEVRWVDIVAAKTRKLQAGDFNAIAVSPDGTLAAIAQTESVQIRNVVTGALVATLPAHFYYYPIVVAFKADNSQVIVDDADNVKLYGLP